MKNLLQFPANPRVSDSTLACLRRVCAHRSSLVLLSRSLTSPSRTGSHSLSASSLTRGANNSIVCLFAFVRCGHLSLLIAYERRCRTSQFSRMKQRPPATDLSGPKASAESLTARRTNLAEDDAVEPQSGLFSSTAVLVPTVSFLALSPLPACSRPPPVETRGSGCGKEVDEPTLSSRPPGPGLSPLRLSLPNRCLTSLLNLENLSRRSSMFVSNRC